MTFEEYPNESSYDSSKNEINDRAKELLEKRKRHQQTGKHVLSLLFRS